MARYHKAPRPLEFKNSRGQTIKSWKDWEAVYANNPGHFVQHRSAYSVAEFMLKNNGGEYLRARISQLLGEPVVLQEAKPELEVRFDNYGKGRFHDLGIYGRNEDSNKSVFKIREAIRGYL